MNRPQAPRDRTRNRRIPNTADTKNRANQIDRSGGPSRTAPAVNVYQDEVASPNPQMKRRETHEDNRVFALSLSRAFALSRFSAFAFR